MDMEQDKQKLKILIVDNHAELVKQIEARLSMEEDFEICMVSPLSQLAHSLIDCKPDLMLIDPYFENSYKYDRIKLAMEMRPEMIVVVLTAVVDPAMSIRLKKEGVHCVLEKGLSSAELVDSLRKVIVDACEPKTSERP
jgi:DNA-binding NarL/FixJ family response regulator